MSADTTKVGRLRDRTWLLCRWTLTALLGLVFLVSLLGTGLVACEVGPGGMPEGERAGEGAGGGREQPPAATAEGAPPADAQAVPTPVTVAGDASGPLTPGVAQPLTRTIGILHTNDTWGYLEPCG